jgi:glycosyltransferase involved in cell wall biosynthesis
MLVKKKSANRSLFVAVALPPPVHGQSVVNKAVCESLINDFHGHLIVHDISPRVLKKNTRYHANRLISVVKAISKLMAEGINSRGGAAYFVLESGYGFLYNILLIGVAKIFSRTVYIHHHTAFHTITKSQKFRFINFISGKETIHFVLCDGMKKDIQSLYPNIGRVDVVNNASFIGEYRSKGNRIPEEVFNLGYISNLCVEKGALTVFNAYRHCRTRGLEINLFIAGPLTDGITQVALNALIRDYPHDVKYLGPVYGDAKQDFYRLLDVALFPSRYKYEAQPLVILEALQRGIPILATPQGYIGDLLDSLRLVLPAEQSSYCDSVYEKLSYWKENPSAYIDLSNAAKNKFEELNELSKSQFSQMISELAGDFCEVA